MFHSGRPKPSLHWLSNGRHVQSGTNLESEAGVTDEATDAAVGPPHRVLGESVNEDDVVTSSLVVGPVHRRDVDSTFTCLASNSNMTQASRATVLLQMNRKLCNSIDAEQTIFMKCLLFINLCIFEISKPEIRFRKSITRQLMVRDQ